MKLAKNILSIFTATAMVITMGTLSVFASTTISKNSIEEDDGKEGMSYSAVRHLAAEAFNDYNYDVSYSDFEIDEDESTASLTSSIETVEGETYVLVFDNNGDDIDTESGYDTDEDELTYTYYAGDSSVVTKEKITVEDGDTGLTLSEVQELAADAFNEYNYDVDDDDFEQISGTDLSSSSTTKAGKTYKFECEDIEVEDDYTTDVDTLIYIYEVEDDDDDTATTTTTASTFELSAGEGITDNAIIIA